VESQPASKSETARGSASGSVAESTDIINPEYLSTIDSLQAKFQEQGEFLLLEDFLRPAVVEELTSVLSLLRSSINRNYIPRHKKGGSVSRYELDRVAPAFGNLYRHPDLNTFLIQLTQAELLHCPRSDPHTYALYYYTEPGDHIGFHYDTSYYRGYRYTVLFGLVDDCSNRLEYQLYRDVPDHKTVEGAVALSPGAMLVFNGDKLYHRVTPLGENETRIILTLEFVTDIRMHPFRRFVSNMKDGIAYFGLRQVFSRRTESVD